MFPSDIQDRAQRLIARLRTRNMTVATAESCTGGLVAAVLTSITGSSDVFEQGFVTYSNAAKTQLIGVDAELLARVGAVSAEVAEAMATGALRAAEADVAVGITGIAGPGGGSEEKPVGLVYIGAAARNGTTRVERFTFGDIGREGVRLASVREALKLLEESMA